MDQIGTAGRNGVFGPNYFNTDLALQKNFPIHESLFAQFRVDAYNAFNHMSLGNPGGSIDNGEQTIGGIVREPVPNPATAVLASPAVLGVSDVPPRGEQPLSSLLFELLFRIESNP